ncbi:MAG: pentapeptide repeat-containing protein [Herbiconiux sp.]|uniref:pentapeptide repeat-containing protein n=1 Tax=Herbiconiux sp. TaxID=1871186 RepID=UPI0011FA6C1C|nr:pentapeptide repeat-containing protein [Herbiconiux sp.]TAJ49151.1 MAG: pentapeptide repeat-containing protein [Herbiconiux sp.]
MASKRTAPPRLDPIVLRDLREGHPDALEPHETVEGERFTAADLSGRDLSGATFLECEFSGLAAHETDLRAASFVESTIERLDAPIFAAPRSRFREVSIASSRLGSAEFFEASWSSVRLEQCKLGYLNLGGAALEDVLFTDCTIDELDLSDARVTRLAFENCEVRTLRLTRSRLTDVDLRGLELNALLDAEGLRGATLSDTQVAQLATLFATQLGIRIDP